MRIRTRQTSRGPTSLRTRPSSSSTLVSTIWCLFFFYFGLFNTIQLTVNKCSIEIFRCLDSNRGLLVLEATTLPTEPKPLQIEDQLYLGLTFHKIFVNKSNILFHDNQSNSRTPCRTLSHSKFHAIELHASTPTILQPRLRIPRTLFSFWFNWWCVGKERKTTGIFRA